MNDCNRNIVAELFHDFWRVHDFNIVMTTQLMIVQQNLMSRRG